MCRSVSSSVKASARTRFSTLTRYVGTHQATPQEKQHSQLYAKRPPFIDVIFDLIFILFARAKVIEQLTETSVAELFAAEGEEEDLWVRPEQLAPSTTELVLPFPRLVDPQLGHPVVVRHGVCLFTPF